MLPTSLSTLGLGWAGGEAGDQTGRQPTGQPRSDATITQPQFDQGVEDVLTASGGPDPGVDPGWSPREP
jgi:hypothetical protein